MLFRSVSNPHHDELDAEVRKILDELGVAERPTLRVLNKVDCLSPEECEHLARHCKSSNDFGPDAGDVEDRTSENGAVKNSVAENNPVMVSGLTGEGIPELLRRIDLAMPTDPTVTLSLRMPLSEGRKLALIHALGKVLRSEVDDSHMLLDAEIPESIVRRLRLADYKFAGTFPLAVS